MIISVLSTGKDNSPEDSVSARAAKVAVEACTGVSDSPQIIVSTTELIHDTSGHSAINVADLAVAAVDEAEHPRFIGKRFTVAY